jgi:hypothetical protein
MVELLGLQKQKLLSIIMINMVDKKKGFRLTKNNLNKIKKFHEVSGPLRKKIADTDFSKSKYEFSKIFLALSILSSQQ